MSTGILSKICNYFLTPDAAGQKLQHLRNIHALHVGLLIIELDNEV